MMECTPQKVAIASLQYLYSLVCGLDITNIVLYMSTDNQAKALRTIRTLRNLELEKLSPEPEF
jgi:hypothetical protein